MEMVSVKISVEHKRRIEELKAHPRETIDDVIGKLLWMSDAIREGARELEAEALG